MSQSASIGLFIISAVTLLAFVSSVKKSQKLRKMIHKEYLSTLERMFRIVKTAPRHTVSDVFVTRKAYFEHLYQKCNMPKTTKVVHVAGTKGKGSTVEYIASALRTIGKVGVFTSPHLHTARERFKVDNKIISKQDFIQTAQEVIRDIDTQQPTLDWMVFFDYLLAMAINYFSKQKLDYLVLETGIGGRYDSTNFLSHCEVSVITRIGIDHQAMLGDTLMEIAWQKAGIIKPNGVVFTPANQKSIVIDVIMKECINKNADLHLVPIGREYIPKELNWDLDTLYPVQYENICLSVAVLKYLNCPIQGMKQYYWPCRMEKFSLTQEPNIRNSPPLPLEYEMIIDSSHNEESVALFLDGVYKHQQGNTAFSSLIIILFGAGAEKCVTEMIQVVRHHPIAHYVVFLQSKHFKAMSEQELYQTYLPDGGGPDQVKNMKENIHETTGNIHESVEKEKKDNNKIKQLLPHTLFSSYNMIDLHNKKIEGTITERVQFLLDQISNESTFYMDLIEQYYEQQGKQSISTTTTTTTTTNRRQQINKITFAVCGSIFSAAEVRETVFKNYPELFGKNDWVIDSDNFE